MFNAFEEIDVFLEGIGFNNNRPESEWDGGMMTCFVFVTRLKNVIIARPSFIL